MNITISFTDVSLSNALRLVQVLEAEGGKQLPASEAPPPAAPSTTSPTAGVPKAMAKAKTLAEEHGIDWRDLFPGSGKGGMVRQDDVRKAIQAQGAATTTGGDGGEKQLEYSDIRQLGSQLVVKTSKDEVRGLLQKHFDVSSISALAATDYAKCAEVFQAGLDG